MSLALYEVDFGISSDLVCVVNYICRKTSICVNCIPMECDCTSREREKKVNCLCNFYSIWWIFLLTEVNDLYICGTRFKRKLMRSDSLYKQNQMRGKKMYTMREVTDIEIHIK